MMHYGTSQRSAKPAIMVAQNTIGCGPYLSYHGVMKVCQKCGEPFPNKAKISGKVRVLASRKFCLRCSPFGTHNTKPVLAQEEVPTGKRRSRGYDNIVFCVVCGQTRPGRDRRCFPCFTRIRKYRAKRRAVDLLGGACSRCGWDEHIAGFQFHHPDPTVKEANVGRLMAHGKPWEKIEVELTKCVLLCANCHAIEHSKGEPDWESLSTRKERVRIPEVQIREATSRFRAGWSLNRLSEYLGVSAATVGRRLRAVGVATHKGAQIP